MTKNHLLVFGLLMLLWLQNSVVQAQDRCATMTPYVSNGGKNPKLKALNEFEEKLQKLIKEKESQNASNLHIVNGVYKIPIVFQIIHNGEAIGTGLNISKDRILAQLAVLNQDFRRIAATPGFNTDPRGADTQIEFILARRRPDGSAFPAGEEGINRVNRTSIPTLGAPPYAAQGADIENKIKPYSTVTQGYDGTKYMNFWSISMSGGTLGYAQFPATSLNGMDCDPGSITTDGVVMLPTSIGGGSFPGTATPYHLGRTATHEIGHWLGLRHIWGDGTCGDDFCGDTPTHQGSNFGCPTHPLVRCGTADEMFENYMDYTDDGCMNIFTKDQGIRMRTTLENFRLSLINSTAGIPPAVNDASVLAIVSPISDVCGTTVTPVISVRNTGSAIITSLSVEYQINAGAIQTKAFTGLNIASGAITNLTLDPIGGIIGNNTIRAVTKLPNGVTDTQIDLDESNATFTSIGGTVPLLESFEGDFLPLGWGRENPGNDCVNWSPAVSSTLIGATGGVTKAAVIPFSRTATSGLQDFLITRMLDLTVANPNTKLQFEVAYCQKTNSDTDRLQVQVSTDCGTTWVATPIYDKTGTPLITRPSSTGDFIPSNALEWRKESIDLGAYVGQKVKFRFVATSGGGNNLYIDNVSFIDKPTFSFATSSTSTPEATTTVLSCYGYTDITIPVKASFAPAVATTLNVSLTGIPTATAGTDFQLLTPTITFPAGSAADQLVTIRIFDDAATEVSETFAISLALAVANTGFLQPAVPTNTVTIRDNDSFPLATVIWSENFETQTEGTVPDTGTGWLRRTLQVGANDWVIGSSTDGITGKSAYISNNPTTRPVEYTSAGAIPDSPGITSRSRLVSPAISTVGFTNLEISFDFKCIGESTVGGTNNLWDIGRLYYSTTPTGTYQSITGAGTPSEATTTTANGGFTGATPFTNQGNITNFSVALPAACDNQPALYFIWRWDNDANDGNNPPFVIDNIVLVTRPTPVIETALNATTTKYLGPNSTVHFFNAANKLIAKIENPTAHDYGCTTVKIDRTGTTNRELWNATASTFLAEKTILVTPTNVNVNSALKVTTYYTDAEVTAYNAGATPNTMATNANVISTGGAISNLSAATPFANGATNNVGGTSVRGTTLSGIDRFVQSSFVSGLAANNGFGTGNPNGPALVSFVNATTATPEAPTTPTLGGDCRPYTDYTIPLKISAAPTQALTVTVSLAGTAISVVDYVLLTPTVTFPAASAANQNATVRVFDDGATEAAETIILNIAVAPSAPVGGVDIASNASITLNIAASDNIPNITTLFSEDFEGLTLGEVTNATAGATWSKRDVTAGTNKWVIGENAAITGSKAAYISQNVTTRPLTYSTSSTSRTRLLTPAINTTGSTSLQLSFDFKVGGEFDTDFTWDYMRLMYSTNGTTFTNITGPADGTGTGDAPTAAPFFNKPNTTNYTVTLPAACQNQATLYLVFRWDNDGSLGANPPIAIDNILLTTSVIPVVETVLATNTQALGPNQTVYFSNAGKVMARIVNLTAFDYGCTTVAIDRNGTGATDLWNTPAAERATNKTFRVTPTNESATGSYEITLYHETAEVTGWQTATSKVWNTNAKVIRSGGAISNITPAAPTANGNTNVIASTTNIAAYNTTSRGTTSTFTNMTLGGGFAVGDPLNKITLGTIVGTNFCQGSTVDVPFTVVANFNAGNVFTAQLSNDGFVTSTAIGTLTSTTSGTIVATIPVIAANTNYRIRVVGSNPVISSADNGVNLTVSATVVSITTQPTPQAICAGLNATFTVAATAATFQWQVQLLGTGAFTNITGNATATTASLTLTAVPVTMNTNIYRCIVTFACGDLTSNAVALTVTSPNAATITYAGSPFCSNVANPIPTIVGTTGGTFTGTVGLVINASTGQINLSTSTAAAHTVTYTMAANGGCPQVIATANITINRANVAPTINAMPSLSLGITPGLQTVNLAGIGIGAGDLGQTLSVTATSSNLALIPNPTVIYTPSNATGSITFTPIAAQTGNATITVIVTDNGSATCGINVTTTTFFVSVGAPPPPPPNPTLNQTITFDSLQTVVFSNQLYQLTATASSTLPVSYTISGNATVLGLNFLQLTGLGDVIITANQAGGFVNNTRYLAAAPVTRRLRVIAASQTLTGFETLADRPWNSPDFQVRAVTNSNLPITFTITEGANIAEIRNGNIVTLKPAIGRVTITATQAGNATTNAATPIVRSFNVTKADQVINSVANVPTLTYRVGLTQTLSASATSGLAVTASVVSGNATITNNNVLSFTSAGSVVIRYAQAGNDLWNAATSVDRTIVVEKANQNITLTSSPTPMLIGTSQTVVASASSGLPVTMRVVSGTATINGLVITPTDGSSVEVELNQAGDANYNAATPVRFTISVIPTLSLTSVSGTKFCGGAVITVNFVITGAFSPNNRIIAYLSDANGVFTNDRRYIGSIDSKVSGSITGIIPENIPSGKGYKVRMESIFPVVFSAVSTQTLELNAVPEMAIISQDGAALVSSIASGVQWFANGLAISGATSQRYTPTAAQSAANTLYSVVITNASGCTSVSGFATYQPPIVTGIDNPALSAKLSVYPNPTENKITVELGLENVGTKAAKVGIKLTDAAGRIVFNENVSTNGLNFKHDIDMKDLASGVYMLLLNVEGKTAVKRIVKQ